MISQAIPWRHVVVALALLTALPGRAADGQNQNTLVVGFTAAHFTDINRADAMAAMKVWVETVIKARGFDLKARTLVYDTVDALSAALETGTPDLMILLTPEYLDLEQSKVLIPEYISLRGTKIGESYLVVVRRDSGITSLSQLRHRYVVIKLGARMSLAECWLNGELTAASLSPLKALCAGVTHEKNVSRTVLPVFFGKTDACVITRNGFDMMCELNPQLRRQLHVIAVSPQLVPSVICMRAGYDAQLTTDVLSGLGNLRKEPRGQQILSLFGVDRLVPFVPEYLDAAAAIYKQQHRTATSKNSLVSRTAGAEGESGNEK